MFDETSVGSTLAGMIVSGVEDLCLEAERSNRPLEVDPLRSQLFELFVTAHGAGMMDEDAEDDLTADALCKTLGSRWDLADATRQSIESQRRLPPEHLARMRLLWSVMRMWMEWTYAWDRWPEFHGKDA